MKQVKIHWTDAKRKGSHSFVDPDRAKREIAAGVAVADAPKPKAGRPAKAKPESDNA